MPANTALQRTRSAPLRSPLSFKTFGALLTEGSERREILRAPVALVIGIAVLLLAACAGGASKGKWTLEAYNRDKGYTFKHDGIVFHTRCIATGRPVLTDGKPDLDAGVLPPEPAYDQSACADVLPYLHKPVPSLTQPYPSILLFVGDNNWRLEFGIDDAK